MSIWIIFKLLGSLALLMFGMKSMSEALQKMAGPQLRHVLGAMTTNRFTGMLTGMLVTASVQSSTATTVMTVSFVNAGLLTLAQAISVIMGANIGTTLTAWIMSAGMSFDITSAVYPAFFLGIIVPADGTGYSENDRHRNAFGRKSGPTRLLCVVRSRFVLHHADIPVLRRRTYLLRTVVGSSYGHHHDSLF